MTEKPQSQPQAPFVEADTGMSNTDLFPSTAAFSAPYRERYRYVRKGSTRDPKTGMERAGDIIGEGVPIRVKLVWPKLGASCERVFWAPRHGVAVDFAVYNEIMEEIRHPQALTNWDGAKIDVSLELATRTPDIILHDVRYAHSGKKCLIYEAGESVVYTAPVATLDSSSSTTAGMRDEEDIQVTLKNGTHTIASLIGPDSRWIYATKDVDVVYTVHIKEPLHTVYTEWWTNFVGIRSMLNYVFFAIMAVSALLTMLIIGYDMETRFRCRRSTTHCEGRFLETAGKLLCTGLGVGVVFTLWVFVLRAVSKKEIQDLRTMKKTTSLALAVGLATAYLTMLLLCVSYICSSWVMMGEHIDYDFPLAAYGGVVLAVLVGWIVVEGVILVFLAHVPVTIMEPSDVAIFGTAQYQKMRHWLGPLCMVPPRDQMAYRIV